MALAEIAITDIVTGVMNELESYAWGALGTDGTAFSLSQTSLQVELLREAVVTQVKEVDARTFDVTVEFNKPNTLNGQTVREVGIFDASSSGSMGGRDTVTPKTFGLELAKFTMRVTVGVTTDAS